MITMNMKKMLPVMAFTTLAMGASAQGLKSGINLSNLDTSVKPSEDFFEFACGGWMKANPLPAAYSRFGSFEKLIENNDKQINGILDDLKQKTYADGSLEKKLSDLYKMATDSVRREEVGLTPVLNELKKFEAAKTKEALFALQLEMMPTGDNEFFGAYLGADEKNAGMNILNIVQGGITLGQKEYYLEADSSTTAIREAYKKHVVRMFQLFGFSEQAATGKMQNLLKLETALAKASKSMAELRDAEANYHKMTLADFQNRYPNLQLEKQANATGIDSKHIQELVVGQPEFIEAANKLVGEMSADEYRDYMEWGVIMSSANYLNNEVMLAQFDFFGKTLSGRKEVFPLWKRATSQVESMMGEALGKIYVEKYFSESSKKRMEVLVANLQKSLAERIQAQEWMSEATKAKALDKLNAFYVKIGYPDKWTDMSGLVIDPSQSYYENVISCRKFWTAWGIEQKAGKPVDREEWHMNPQTVNAYYNPTTNEICFPAGILQKPFFDPDADDAFNYGAIGVVIGHEMTHGFDDQGRHYDKNGNMTDWWSAEDADNFSRRADVCVNYFNNIKVLADLNANGQLTLGENLADHGGLKVAFNAFRNATKASPLAEKDGFTPEQRFFIAYAGVWAANVTDLEIRKRTKSDPHSLGRWRVNGALPHIDEWYEAFSVKKSDKLFVDEKDRVSLW